MTKGNTGTREWSSSSINIALGCAHDCRYCYAKAQMIRFKRKTIDNWTDEVLNEKAISARYGKRDGRIMLPTTHDITDATIDAMIAVTRRLLAAGNELLIVSKPYPDLLRCFREGIQDWNWDSRKKVLFRFTISTLRDELLSYWEPNAPSFVDRCTALNDARRDGWQTSVSMEPMLDSVDYTVDTFLLLRPAVTDSIWIGKMNQARQRVEVNGGAPSSLSILDNHSKSAYDPMSWVEHNQTDDQIMELHSRLEHEPLVRWKDSIKKVVRRRGA